MKTPQPNININVDVTNPGQFFACCGLLELADRLWPGVEGWFEVDQEFGRFIIKGNGTLSLLVKSIAESELIQVNTNDPYASPLIIGKPFRPICIDWWETDQTGARDLKPWAGTMESYGIAHAMQHAMRSERFFSSDLFDCGMVVTTPDNPKKKKEPYYFDARRAGNAHSRDIGFSPNDLKLTSIAHPAVELLCLVGLQVARPTPTLKKRVYDYFTWHSPRPSSLLMAVSTGFLVQSEQQAYRFENRFRTGQKKHKAFSFATPII